MKLCLTALIAVLSCWGAASQTFESLADLDAEEGFFGADSCEPVTDRPVVGVLTQPVDEEDRLLGLEYIAGSYVKYLESAGLRVVPIRYSWKEEKLRETFNSVNALFLPGGAADLEPGSAFFDASSMLFRWAVEENNAGNVFSIWGTCLGFEQLAVLAAGDNSTVLEASGKFDSEDFPAPITLTQMSGKSDILGNMSPSMLRAITTKNITYNSHENGISPEVFYGNKKLSSFFENLATFHDKQGKPFIAVIEAKTMPIYGIQFHPEKAVYEWHLPTKIPHSPDAIKLSQYFSNFFASKARCNSHKFIGGEEAINRAVIEKRAKVHLINEQAYMQEKYIF